MDAPLRVRGASGAVLVGGGALYAALVGGAGLSFDLTPSMIGATAVLAGFAGRQPRLLAIGTTLLGWGASVMLVRHGPIPDAREAPAFMIGLASGLLVARSITRRWDLDLVGSLLTALNGGLAFYLAYDIDALGDWPCWALALAAWGAFEIVSGRGRAHGATSSAGHGDGPSPEPGAAPRA